jgi:hypothetical protein
VCVSYGHMYILSGWHVLGMGPTAKSQNRRKCWLFWRKST